MVHSKKRLSQFADSWIPDKESHSCMVCQTPFTLFYRKHHCRKCGRLICEKCSLYKKLDLLPALSLSQDELSSTTSSRLSQIVRDQARVRICTDCDLLDSSGGLDSWGSSSSSSDLTTAQASSDSETEDEDLEIAEAVRNFTWDLD